MRILDRYIIQSVFVVFLTCLFSFLFLYIIVDAVAFLADILKQKTDPWLLAQYYFSYLPIIFVKVSPFSCLLATLYTFGKLNRNNEVIAMRAAGLSIMQITKTVIIFGAVVSLVVFWVNDRFVPSSVSMTKKIRDQIEGYANKPRSGEPDAISNLSMYGSDNRLFFVNKFTLSRSAMEGIIIFEHDRHQEISRKIIATSAVFKDKKWTFYQALTYDLDMNGQLKGDPRYAEEEVMNIPETPRDFLNQRQRPDSMTIAQVSDYIRKLSTSGAITAVRNLRIDLYQKFTDPLTSLLIIILAIPFSLRVKKRSGGLASLGLSIVMGFLYYVLNAVGIALGKGGIIMPMLSVSISHIIIFLTSLYLISELP
jgi:lipopolysaccharide export system permease protein